ncbi:MAG: hypothetical protein VKK80_09535 [Prochlorothrix sp.]|nr:hypothetical protein [Prochlorothrix sp.]
MNAAELATSLEITSKITAIVHLFKSDFPDARVDLKPWCNDDDTRRLVDPDSLDIGFHLPGWSPRYECRSILVQTRLSRPAEADEGLEPQRLLGLEIVGFSYDGEEWRLSTIANWRFLGRKQPAPEIQDRFKHFCRQVFTLYSSPQENAA